MSHGNTQLGTVNGGDEYERITDMIVTEILSRNSVFYEMQVTLNLGTKFPRNYCMYDKVEWVSQRCTLMDHKKNYE